ncbi:GAF and ANTAR domain-containing protein [Lacisediminihabitans profunda]|uniref:GAF and ANTAR domain-containing protein n=1 Tax=Lacisediminihabitans profunda TaxID=2594790 RepID=UPI001FECDA0A|nr:GAF and ANTAR domain-containing protein [Lacisediminihabitans profunda]
MAVTRETFEEAKRAIIYSLDRDTSLCAPFLSVVPVTGVSVSVLVTRATQATICSSNATASHLDELQFDLGEGPCWEALSSRRPALHSDVQGEDQSTWPAFANAVRGSDVHGMFAFPLVVGSLDIGAVDLYSSSVGGLTAEQVADASALAQLTGWQVLRRLLNQNPDDEEGSSHSRREVHQATGMVLAQLGINAEEASLLLRAHAFSSGRSVREISNDVVERRLDFSTGASQ